MLVQTSSSQEGGGDLSLRDVGQGGETSLVPDAGVRGGKGTHTTGPWWQRQGMLLNVPQRGDSLRAHIYLAPKCQQDGG